MTIVDNNHNLYYFMHFVESNKKTDTEIFFNTQKQCYFVFRNSQLLITNKYKYSDVKSYVN